MQDVITITLALAGLFFSICCGLLLEELMFGVFFRAMSPGRGEKSPTLSREKRAGQGWATQQEWTIPVSQQRHEGEVSCSH